VGVVGGSGLDALAGLTNVHEEDLTTPYGRPSGPYRLGELGGVPVAFLSRHGRGHVLSPPDINYRANVYGFKVLGCDAILSASAVGSLKEELAPTHVVIPSQFIDRTQRREATFFSGGIVAHISLAEPVCPSLGDALEAATRACGAGLTRGGTYICIEGPSFSTRAESLLYRSWGADVIGMTNLTEARLAREAEICYGSLTLVTDYDSWRENTEGVSVETILSVLRENAAMAERALLSAVSRIPPDRGCNCRTALRFAVLTDPKCITAELRERLRPLLGKYFP
jgi:5'-methylthioadenosine phosphorylase